MTIEELVDQEMSYKDFESEMLKPDLTEDFLEHHGILGQKWGVRNGPPYPLGSDKSTGSRLKSGASGTGDIQKKKPAKKSFAEKRKAKKVYKKRVQAAQKARETKAAKAAEAKAKAAEEERKAKEAQEAQDRAEKEQLEREQWKRDIINRGDINTAKEHTDLFDNDEIQEIINRYQSTSRLSQLVADTQPQTPEEKTKYEKIREKVDKLQKVAGTVSDVANSVKKVYDAYNTVNDILNSGSKKAQEAQEKQNKAKEEQAKAQKEAQAKKEEEWKNNIIMTRDMAAMLANKNKFTSDEINKLIRNVDADKTLADKINETKKGGSGTQEAQPPKQEEAPKQQTQQPKQETQPSKSAEPQSNQQSQKKPDLSPSLMDKVLARAQKSLADQRANNERQRHDKDFYRNQSTEALKLMKANMEEEGVAVSQINLIEDVLRDRQNDRKSGYYSKKR